MVFGRAVKFPASRRPPEMLVHAAAPPGIPPLPGVAARWRRRRRRRPPRPRPGPRRTLQGAQQQQQRQRQQQQREHTHRGMVGEPGVLPLKHTGASRGPIRVVGHSSGRRSSVRRASCVPGAPLAPIRGGPVEVAGTIRLFFDRHGDTVWRLEET